MTATGFCNEQIATFVNGTSNKCGGKMDSLVDGDVDNDANWIYCRNGFVSGVLNK